METKGLYIDYSWNASWKFNEKIWYLPSMATVFTMNPFMGPLLHVLGLEKSSEFTILLNMPTVNLRIYEQEFDQTRESANYR